jgi:hypothetical protein
MNTVTKIHSLKKLQVIPGVGKSIAVDLWELGIRRVDDLKGKSPEKLYEKRCTQVGTRIDPCLLYVFRGAVYYASTTRHEPELLKWWNWKDRTLPRR